MMLTSNYDNHLVGVDGDDKAGAANGNIIICKHDSKLYDQKILMGLATFFRFEASNAPPHLFCVGRILVFGVLETGLKRLKAAKREARTPGSAAWRGTA